MNNRTDVVVLNYKKCLQIDMSVPTDNDMSVKDA